MSLAVKIRRADSSLARRLRRAARNMLAAHLPVNALTRPLFRTAYWMHVAGREGGLWVLRFLWFEPLFRSHCHHVGQQFRMERLPYLSGRGRITIGSRVRLSGQPSIRFSNRLHDDPRLTIGDDTFIGHQCAFAVADSIIIGRHCLLAGSVRISDFDGHPVDAHQRRLEQPTPPEGVAPVIIEDDVWIGRGACILKGVTVGARSIVGAGAIVTKDVPPDTVVAGNPARIVKQLAPQSPRQLAEAAD